MVAPPVGSAAAIAAMLRMNIALALVGSVVISMISPLYLPALARLLGAGAMDIDMVHLMSRIAVIVLGAAATTVLLRRWASQWLDDHPDALTGVTVVGLIVVGIGVMKGMQPLILAHPGEVARVVAIAFAANVGAQLMGLLLFLPLGLRDAATVGLLSGYRNVTLIAVVAAPWLAGSPNVQMYIAASVLPIFMLPLLTSALARVRVRIKVRPPTTRFGELVELLVPGMRQRG
jgi:predicted Na+-dependent transporter